MDLEKELNNYIDTIVDLYNTPQNIKWGVESDKVIGLFSIDNKKFKIVYDNSLITLYMLCEDNWNQNITNMGIYGFSLLSTVMFGVNYLYKTYNLTKINFKTIDDSKTRLLLYKHEFIKFCHLNNLTFIDNCKENELNIILTN